MTAAPPRELEHFERLDREQQEQAIRQLARDGMSAYAIAAATRLSVEQIRQILAASELGT